MAWRDFQRSCYLLEMTAKPPQAPKLKLGLVIAVTDDAQSVVPLAISVLRSEDHKILALFATNFF